MADGENMQTLSRSRAGAFAVAFLGAGAFFTAPLISYFDPLAFSNAGVVAAIIAGSAYALYVSPITGTLGKIVDFVFYTFVLLGGFLVIRPVEVAGEKAALANRNRCLAIQVDMLAAQPRRTDGPDLFQALGCRPQGSGPAYAKPTKLELAAGHPLPEGGRR